MNKNKSFTLIEILIVIVIIGILAGVIMISTSSSIDKTKDGIRRNDLGMISRGLRTYQAMHGYYPASSCRIGEAGCLTDLVPGYFSSLPTDPVSGYYGYSSTGSEFMLIAKGSSGPITYTDSNGFDGSIVAVSNYYNFLNKIEGGGSATNANDYANGAFWGYVRSFNAGWTGHVFTKSNYGFKAGTYDIYIRLRTDGLGNRPNYVPFGMYNSTVPYYPLSAKNINGLNTSYQVKHAGRVVLSSTDITQDTYLYFSDAGVTTQYYVDYVEFRKVN